MKNLAAQDRAHVFGLDESLLDQLLLDLVQRLAPKVAQSQQLLLTLLEQLPDGLDLVCLEAVERPHGKVELLDRRIHQAVARRHVAVWLRLLYRSVEGHEES